jgi:hypothetical protein
MVSALSWTPFQALSTTHWLLGCGGRIHGVIRRRDQVGEAEEVFELPVVELPDGVRIRVPPGATLTLTGEGQNRLIELTTDLEPRR